MLNKIIKFSLNNRIIVLVASLLLMLAGTYTAINMEVDVFPDLNAPTVVVMTEAKGMAPEEVERMVTFPIETAVNGATDVRRVRSSSTAGFSIVWVEFNWGTDIYRARQVVSEKLTVVRDALPTNVGNPTLGPQSSILGELMIIGLTADTTSLQDLRTIADWTLRPRLLATGGVAQVAVLGGDIREYQILLNPEKMKHYGIALDEVINAATEMNRNASGGVLYEYDNEYIIRGILSTSAVSELGKTVVKSMDDIPVTLENIAQVKIGSKAPKLGVASERGKAAVLLTVTKQPAASTMELTEKLDQSLAELQPSLPADVKVSSDIFRQARFIENSIGNVQKSLYEGGIFVVIVLFIFLMNIRTTFISLITIPLSLVTSILTLKMMGLTINTMSLGGMAIAIGSLVDDAIVDVENVFKRLRENRQKPKIEQKTVLSVVFDASKEVRMPILNSTLIIIASFVPLFFLSGMEGRMLAPLGISFIVALIASTLIALTLTPVLCSYLLGKPAKGDKLEREPFVVRKLKSVYEKALKWTLTRRKWVLGGTGIIFGATIIVFLTLGRTFLPPFNEGSFTINVSTLPGISLEESDKMGRIAENVLMSVPEIQTAGRKTGRAELDEHALGVNVSEIEVPFVLGKRSKDEVLAEIREKLKVLPGVNIEIGQPISHRIDAMLSGTRANIAIKLFGTDLNKMFALGNQVKSSIQNVEGIVDLNVEQQVERPQLKIAPKREMLAKYGVTLPEFMEIINVLLAGEVVSQVYEGNRAFDLTLKVNEESRETAERIRNMTVDANGRKIPFGHIADIESSTGPNTINRENVARKIVISANVAGRDLRGVVNDIQKKINAEIQLPEGYHIEYGGQFESEQAASRTLLIASIFSILVIFLLLFGQFRSVAQSVLILLNLPLALIGGVFTIFFTGGVISIPATIGFISLFGIATRNGMLLISRYNDLQREGLSVRESVMRGSLDRLNPILMTALCSALALIPLAIGSDLPGNEIQSPMAKVILGGLLTSTLLNGFIIPVIHLFISGIKSKNLKISFKNRTMKSVITTIVLIIIGTSSLFAQNETHFQLSAFNSHLKEIELNNTTLKALRQTVDAQKLENKTGTGLTDPEVEFNYLWGNPGETGNRIDVQVKQTFDIPSISGMKNRVASEQNNLLELQYKAARMDILLEAKQYCIELIYCNAFRRELYLRLNHAEIIAESYKSRLDKGDINRLEYNKAQLNLATVQGEIARVEVERNALLSQLKRLNGGINILLDNELFDPISLPSDFEEWFAQIAQKSPLLEYARQETEVGKKQVTLNKVKGLPSFSVGYMIEKAVGQQYQGIMFGISVPLWENKNRIKQAKASVVASEAREIDNRQQLHSQLQILYYRTSGLKTISETYRQSLAAANNADLLKKALDTGEISLLDYIVELGLYYDTINQALEAERDFQKAFAELTVVEL
jgi:Cu(I)/Ag(I) efflux system membrane protein CusA/SilA